MIWKKNERVQMRFDDERYGGGGGGGSETTPLFDLDTRLSSIAAARLSAYKFRRRLIALLFVHPDSDTFRNQVKNRLDYWHFRSGDRLDFMCVGYSGVTDEFDAELFAKSVQWLQERSAWRYGGESDLVLVNAMVENRTSTLRLETDQVVALSLEVAAKEGAIQSVPALMERVFTFTETYAGDDPSWGFSDSEGKRLVTSGLKALLISCLPKGLRKEARAAFQFHVRECSKPAA